MLHSSGGVLPHDTMSTHNHYTFGDSERAARRLFLLAQAFEPLSRSLLERFREPSPALAFDLGCGPGCSTRVVHEATRAERTVGYDTSASFLEEARRAAPAGVSFVQSDVLADVEPSERADLVFCRFLLTHIHDPRVAIATFRKFVAEGGVLLLQETSRLDSSQPALARYYELVAALQSHYGQTLHIGRDLGALAMGAGFDHIEFVERHYPMPSRIMAELHALNLPTWRTDPFARDAFDAQELDELERELSAIAAGTLDAGPVELWMGEAVLR